MLYTKCIMNHGITFSYAAALFLIKMPCISQQCKVTCIIHGNTIVSQSKFSFIDVERKIIVFALTEIEIHFLFCLIFYISKWIQKLKQRQRLHKLLY